MATNTLKQQQTNVLIQVQEPKEIKFEGPKIDFDPTKELKNLINDFQDSSKKDSSGGQMVLGAFEVGKIISQDELKAIGKEEKLLQKAKAEISEKAYDKAAKSLDELLKNNPDHHEAIYLKALCFVYLEKHLDAVDILKYFLLNKPHHEIQERVNSLVFKIRNSVILQIMMLSILGVYDRLSSTLDTLIVFDDRYEPYYFIQATIYLSQGLLPLSWASTEKGLTKVPANQSSRLLNIKTIIEKRLLENHLLQAASFLKRKKYKFAQGVLYKVDHSLQKSRIYVIMMNYAIRLDKESKLFKKKNLTEVPIEGTAEERYYIQSIITKAELDIAVGLIMKGLTIQAMPYLTQSFEYVSYYPFLHFLKALCVYQQYYIDLKNRKFANKVEQALSELRLIQRDAQIGLEDPTIYEAKPLYDEIMVMLGFIEAVYKDNQASKKEAEKIEVLVKAFEKIMQEGKAIRDNNHLKSIRNELNRIKTEAENSKINLKYPENKTFADQLIEAVKKNLEGLVAIEQQFEEQEKEMKSLEPLTKELNDFVNQIKNGYIRVSSRWDCDSYIKTTENNASRINNEYSKKIKTPAGQQMLRQIIATWFSLRSQFEDLRKKF